MGKHIERARAAAAAKKAADQRARREDEQMRAALHAQAVDELRREHSELCSVSLARTLDADPAEPEFRALDWAPIDVEIDLGTRRRGWKGELVTSFEGVGISAEVHPDNTTVTFAVAPLYDYGPGSRNGAGAVAFVFTELLGFGSAADKILASMRRSGPSLVLGEDA